MFASEQNVGAVQQDGSGIDPWTTEVLHSVGFLCDPGFLPQS